MNGKVQLVSNSNIIPISLQLPSSISAKPANILLVINSNSNTSPSLCNITVEIDIGWNNGRGTWYVAEEYNQGL